MAILIEKYSDDPSYRHTYDYCPCDYKSIERVDWIFKNQSSELC